MEAERNRPEDLAHFNGVKIQIFRFVHYAVFCDEVGDHGHGGGRTNEESIVRRHAQHVRRRQEDLLRHRLRHPVRVAALEVLQLRQDRAHVEEDLVVIHVVARHHQGEQLQLGALENHFAEVRSELGLGVRDGVRVDDLKVRAGVGKGNVGLPVLTGD